MDEANWSIPNNNSWHTNDPDTVGIEAELDETGSVDIEAHLPNETSSDLNNDSGPSTNQTTTPPQWHSIDHFEKRVEVFLTIFQKVQQSSGTPLAVDANLETAMKIEEERYFISANLEAYEDIESLEVELHHNRNASERFHGIDLPYPRKLVVVETPTKNDVLFDGHLSNHATRIYHDHINIHRTQYALAAEADKETFVRYAIAIFKANRPSTRYRFLRRYKRGNDIVVWVEIIPNKVNEIVRRDLRDRPNVR